MYFTDVVVRCNMLKEKIQNSILEAIKAAQKLDSLFIENIANLLVGKLSQGGKILIAGNGGSLCDAVHFAEELTGFYRKNRRALAAIALADPGHMSCVGNDLGFDYVFSRAVEALGKKEDVLVVLTTSGNSQNLVFAIEAAKKLGLITVAFLGKDGGKIRGMCDFEWIVKGFRYSDRIQEAHMAAIHIILEMVEYVLFES